MTSQSPVVAPVDACVKCSKFSSFNSLTAGSTLFWNLLSKSSSFGAPGRKSGIEFTKYHSVSLTKPNFYRCVNCKLPWYNIGIPLRKKTTAGSLVGSYNFTNGLEFNLTTQAPNESTKTSRLMANSCSSSWHAGQFCLPGTIMMHYNIGNFNPSIN